ncbi:alpha/beta fold hydrolase [Bradyrhizobium elkanii]|uniref:alpha/beta fold hydrolase n=1 Tax=Bradyrhizobium elkanii TaxID=29448 RepID=UPI0035158446
METVQTRGIELATQCFGSHSDPAILLIMGATASMLGWPDELCTALAKQGLFVIRFDHRDTGRSTTVPPGEAEYSVEDMAEDVIGIMDAYSLQQATLMGMSLGGFIAQIVALTHPQRVQSIILVSSEPLGWDGVELPHISQEFLGHFGDLPKLDWSNHNAVVKFLLTSDRLSSGTSQPFDEASAQTRIEEVIARADNPASMFNHATISTRENWTGRFREIACPTLVIHGEDDPILPATNGRAIAAGIKGADLVILHGVGHELPSATLPEIVERVATHTRRLR